MANYRQFKVDTWQDKDFQELDPLQKFLFIYLFTNSHISESGIYKITPRTIEFETGIKADKVEKWLANGAIKNVEYDVANSVVFVKNFRKLQIGGNYKILSASIHNDFKSIPNSTVWVSFCNEYIGLNELLDETILTLIQPLAKGSPTVSQPLSNNNSNSNNNSEDNIKEKEAAEVTPEKEWWFEIEVVELFYAKMPNCKKMLKPYFKSKIALKTLSSIRARSIERSFTDLQPWGDLFDRLSGGFIADKKFGIDWVALPTNFEKCLMGNYDSDSNNKSMGEIRRGHKSEADSGEYDIDMDAGVIVCDIDKPEGERNE